MKWFLLAAAVVCHVAYADNCAFGTECLTCHNVASYEDCVAENNYVVCTQNNPVCKVEWHINTNGVVYQFSSQCTTNASCNAQTNGPAQALCDDSSPVGLGGNQGNQGNGGRRRRQSSGQGNNGNAGGSTGNGANGNNICRKCISGQCIDPPVTCPDVKHCFTCHAKSDVACWITGQYKECFGDQMCYYTTKPNGHVERGCIPKESCINSANFECDDDGELNPSPPKHDVSVCGTPNYGSCSCKGDPHCNSFDMKEIPNLMGGCSWHLMARDGCDGSYVGQTFAISVELEQIQSGRVAVQSVKIEYSGKVIILGQTVGQVYIDTHGITDISGSSTEDPIVVEDIEFAAVATGNAVRVKLTNEVEIFWDFDRAVGIDAPKGTVGLCGVCGNFNDNPHDDLVYGPVHDAKKACPSKIDLLTGKTEGSLVGPDIEGFSYSWLTEGCADTCG